MSHLISKKQHISAAGLNSETTFSHISHIIPMSPIPTDHPCPAPLVLTKHWAVDTQAQPGPTHRLCGEDYHSNFVAHSIKYFGSTWHFDLIVKPHWTGCLTQLLTLILLGLVSNHTSHGSTTVLGTLSTPTKLVIRVIRWIVSTTLCQLACLHLSSSNNANHTTCTNKQQQQRQILTSTTTAAAKTSSMYITIRLKFLKVCDLAIMQLSPVIFICTRGPAILYSIVFYARSPSAQLYYTLLLSIGHWLDFVVLQVSKLKLPTQNPRWPSGPQLSAIICNRNLRTYWSDAVNCHPQRAQVLLAFTCWLFNCYTYLDMNCTSPVSTLTCSELRRA